MQVFKGSYYEIGLQQGKIYKDNGFSPGNIIPNKEIIQHQLGAYKKYFPGILDELQGIRDGLNCDINIIYQIFLANELQWFRKNYSYKESCTIFGVKNKKGLFVGRNLDWILETKDVMEPFKTEINDKYKFVAISDMLIDSKKDVVNNRLFYDAIDAINEKGLYVGITFAHGTKTKYGLSWKDIVLLISESCTRVDDALNLFKTIPLSVPKNFFIADKTGNMAVVEHNTDKYKIIYPQNGILIKTNHYISPDLQGDELVLKNFPQHNTYKRFNAVLEKLNLNKETIDIGKVLKILSDKQSSICQTRGLYTIWSLVMNMNKEEYCLIKRKNDEQLERLKI